MPRRARSLNLPPRSTSVTDPSARAPAGIATSSADTHVTHDPRLDAILNRARGRSRSIRRAAGRSPSSPRRRAPRTAFPEREEVPALERPRPGCSRSAPGPARLLPAAGCCSVRSGILTGTDGPRRCGSRRAAGRWCFRLACRSRGSRARWRGPFVGRPRRGHSGRFDVADDGLGLVTPRLSPERAWELRPRSPPPPAVSPRRGACEVSAARGSRHAGKAERGQGESIRDHER